MSQAVFGVVDADTADLAKSSTPFMPRVCYDCAFFRARQEPDGKCRFDPDCHFGHGRVSRNRTMAILDAEDVHDYRPLFALEQHGTQTIATASIDLITNR